MKKRNVALCVVFSIITCGIYSIYWFIQLNNCANELADPPKKTSGGVAVLLTIVTCNIYGIYWAYKMGELLETAQERRSMPTQDLKILYLILQLIGLGIVNYVLMQNTINTMLPDNDLTVTRRERGAWSAPMMRKEMTK